MPSVLALMLSLALTAPPKTWTAGSDVELNPLLRSRIAEVAKIYHKRTRRQLHITSGARSPERQALAMYNKLAAGGSLGIYKRQDLAGPIGVAYREGRRRRLPKARVVDAMAAVLREQIAAEQYISRHLSGRAFDIRSRGLSRAQRAALQSAIREVGGMMLIEEKKPPHFHVEIVAN